jgi:tryptophan synthase alpha chain
MSRIQAGFKALRARGRKALIPYITAGDPQSAVTVPLMHAMVEAGADLIELGVPFSDPMADGPVIQAACERALHHGTSLRGVLQMVERFRGRDPDTPVVLMGYLNPIEVMGYGRFAAAAAAAGVDGVLTVDLPPEEAHGLLAALGEHGIDPIFLIAPTSTARRMEAICRVASGFVYYVSLKGVTGAGSLDVQSVAAKLTEIRRFASTPIGVGFGIKDAANAAAIARVADAVVVGSALVRRIQEHEGDARRIQQAVAELLRAMRAAMDAASVAGRVA